MCQIRHRSVFITIIIHIFVVLKSTTQVQCLALGSLGFPLRSPRPRLHRSPSILGLCQSFLAPSRAPGGDGGHAGIARPGRVWRFHDRLQRANSPRAHSGFSHPHFLGGRPDLETIELTPQSVPSVAAERWQRAAGRGLLEGRGKRREKPAREGLAGLAAPRSGQAGSGLVGPAAPEPWRTELESENGRERGRNGGSARLPLRRAKPAESLSLRPGASLPSPATCLRTPTSLPLPCSRLSPSALLGVWFGLSFPARLHWPWLPGQRAGLPSVSPARRAPRVRRGPRPPGWTMVNTRKSSLRLLGSKSPGPGPGPGAGVEPGATGGSSHFISSRTRSSKTRAASCPAAKAGGSGGAGVALDEARVRARRPESGGWQVGPAAGALSGRVGAGSLRCGPLGRLETWSAGAVEGGSRLGRAATALLAALFCVKNGTWVQGWGLLRGRGGLSFRGHQNSLLSCVLVRPERGILGEHERGARVPVRKGWRGEVKVFCGVKPFLWSVSAPAGVWLQLTLKLFGGGSSWWGSERRAPVGSQAGMLKKVCSCSDSNFKNKINTIASPGRSDQTWCLESASPLTRVLEGTR